MVRIFFHVLHIIHSVLRSTMQAKAMKRFNHFLLSGVIVLRKLLPKKFLKLLQLGVKDIVKNKTLHCEMAYFNGPPILHRSSIH